MWQQGVLGRTACIPIAQSSSPTDLVLLMSYFGNLNL